MSESSRFARIHWGRRSVEIEYQWLGVADEAAPLLVFLHEGLGSLSMWKDFPIRLCEAAQCRGLVYSRPGYGQSTARASGEKWGVDFMHEQARVVLPALLEALAIDASVSPPMLYGHSDGGSIALIYAAAFADRVKGIVVLSPHIMVEDISVESIQAARTVYLKTNLRERLGRYHDDPDSAFWGWNDVWLDPAFRDWSIEDEIGNIRCPLLAVQGLDDEYGTLEQIHGIARRVAQTELLELPHCGHSPQRDQPERLLEASLDFLGRHALGANADGTGFCAQY